MFLLLPFLTLQASVITENTQDKFTSFFNPDYAKEYINAGISLTESFSPDNNQITIRVKQLAEYLSTHAENNLVNEDGDVNVKFNITSNNNKNVIDTNYFDIKVAEYKKGIVSGLNDNFARGSGEFECKYKVDNTAKPAKTINFIISYELEKIQVPYVKLNLVAKGTTTAALPPFITVPQTGLQYNVGLDIMALYDNLNSAEVSPYLHVDDTNGKVELKFEYQYKKYDSDQTQDGTFMITILTFTKVSDNTIYNLVTEYYNFEKQLYEIHADDTAYTDIHSDYTQYTDSAKVTVNYIYPNIQNFKLKTRVAGVAAPFFTVAEGTSDEEIATFDYSAEYLKAGMEFNENTNTITLDRLKLLEYIENKDNKLNYLVAGTKGTGEAQSIYITYGLQLKDITSDFLGKYKNIAQATSLNFEVLKNHVDNDDFYNSQPIMYFFVAKIVFDSTTNKPVVSVPKYKDKSEFLIRYIWQGDNSLNKQKYVTSEIRVSIHLKEDYETYTPTIRTKGPAEGLADTPYPTGFNDFDYPAAYTNAGISFAKNVINIDHAKMQEYANAEATKQNFLALCKNIPEISKEYIVYFGLQFNPGDDFTDFLEGGDDGETFAEDKFTPLKDQTDGPRFYNGKVTRYVQVATFVYDGEKIIINEIRDRTVHYKYIYKKEKGSSSGTKANDYVYDYKLLYAPIQIKTTKTLRADALKPAIEGVTLKDNNLHVNLNSLLNLNPIENYFFISGQELLLPVPYTGMSTGLSAYQNKNGIYPFISSNLDYNTYGNNQLNVASPSRYVCVAIMEQYVDGENNTRTRYHKCNENGYNEEEPFFLTSESDITKGIWNYKLPSITVNYEPLCTNGENECEQCTDDRLTCAKCIEGYIKDIRTSLCIKDKADPSNFESIQTSCTKEGDTCKVDEEIFSKDNFVYIETSEEETIVFTSKNTPDNAFYKAKDKIIQLAKDAKLNLMFDSAANTVDISNKDDGKVNLKLFTSGDSQINIITKDSTKEVQLDTNDNKISGNFVMNVKSNIEKLIIKNIKLFGATLSARKPSSSKLLENEKPVLLGFTTLEVNERTSLESNAEINDLTLQPGGNLYMFDYETTVKNIIINLGSKTDGLKLITKIPENPKAPDSITINANAIGSDAKTTVPLVAGTYHFDICDKWRDNSKIEKDDKDKFKVICLNPKDVPESAKHLLKTLEEAGADKEPENSYVLAITNDGSLKDALKKDKKKLDGGAIAGIVIACVVVVAAIIALLVYFLVIKKKKQSTSSTQGDSSIAI